ncbi:MAG TPA: EAL domain-containing response regulator [Pseudolabrys sp.]|uniref:EAL domain-containing protein n=1 Tax=Pseudolabrys sp. TaxID=1960880 RepID=UPI002DDD9BF6|nr:EAL domain-containing response regulator [Pseudolabrys sp.]HEV2630809.1 EAL domain-containing response regulator [Pseudolabrys sp.]
MSITRYRFRNRYHWPQNRGERLSPTVLRYRTTEFHRCKRHVPVTAVRFCKKSFSLMASAKMSGAAMFKARKWLASALADESVRPKAKWRGATRASGSPLRANSCFIVDDDPGVRRLIANAIASTGAVCIELDSLVAVSDRLLSFVPSLIFLDISLRDSDAIDVIRELSAKKYRGAVQLISGRSEVVVENVHSVGLKHGLNMLSPLAKPCSISAIRGVVTEQLKRIQEEGVTEGAVVDLDAALQNGWVEVWYQPKIDLKLRRIAGVEALSRVCHPQLGTVLPSEFLLHASRSCLRRLTEHVILTCLREWSDLRGVGYAIKIAINVSGDCLSSVPIPKLIREHRPHHANWPGLVFELDEEQAAEAIDGLHDIASQLMIYDVSFAVDNFGTGRASFPRLKKFAFSELKLDASYVQGCSTNEQNSAICRSIVELAHSFGAAAVAKSVEAKEDLVELYKMNCDMAQGHLLARPMPMNDLIPFLRLKAQRQRLLSGSGAPSATPVLQLEKHAADVSAPSDHASEASLPATQQG